MAIRVALPTLQRSSDSGWTVASCEYGVFKLVDGGGEGDRTPMAEKGVGGRGGRGRVLNIRVFMHICLL